MCLALPMKLTAINGSVGLVELGGIKREVGLELLDQVQLGDYLLIHAGYAIEILDAGEAELTLKFIRDLEENS